MFTSARALYSPSRGVARSIVLTTPAPSLPRTHLELTPLSRVPGGSAIDKHPLRSYSSAFSRSDSLCTYERASALYRKGKDKKGKGSKGNKNEEGEAEVGGGAEAAGEVTARELDRLGEQMNHQVKKCTDELGTLKIGRADPTLLDNIIVSTGGKAVPINAVAQVSIRDGATLSVAAYNVENLHDISVAIRDAKMDLAPTQQGNVLLVPIPKPTKEFRDKLNKMAEKFTEHARVEVRQLRRNALDQCKKRKLPKDEDFKAQKERIHDKYLKMLDELLEKKHKDLNQ